MKQSRILARRAATLVLFLLTLWPAAAVAEEHQVTISGLNFVPSDLVIEVGDTVTWTNNGGLHNVNADDGTFFSGPSSTDIWVYSFTFHEGGEWTYRCDTHPNQLVGTVTVEGIYGDRFETGDHESWSTATDPVSPNCNCYFAEDCVAPTPFCDYGVLIEEDICLWRENKPNGVPGAGCDVDYEGPWVANICDGTCSSSAAGSGLGWENPELLQEGARLWAEAILQPAEAGGGPVDAELAGQALALPFKGAGASFALGRQVTDLFIDAGIPELGDHFCHYEGHPGEPDPALYVDLSNDPCRQIAARRAVDALLAELRAPGSGARVLDEVRGACLGWQTMFAPRCAEGPGALDCLAARIADLALFLSTPRDFGNVLNNPFADPVTTAGQP